MSLSRSRQFFTFLLVCGAVVFGMVLAGGMQMTPTAQGGPASVSAPLNYSGSSFPDFADLAAAVDPAVVSIRSTKFDKEGGPRSGNPFDFFLQPRPKRGAPQEEEPSEPRRSEAGGSGFVVSEDGLIVTNFHVIRGASEITVTLEEREFKAEVRGTDPSTDLALLKINAGHPLTYLRLGDSDALR
ncbi:MAG TPA: trypsin-like peptidase domain-containing protein, partial [Thermoanaerobaculia bacterium]|nr:trypsin-like peptidase domain-containing protein [Thermoanaerobaculia bacterium]